MTRNEEICRLYKSGLTLYDLSDCFQLSHERIRQILRRSGVTKDDRKTASSSDRSAFLGVNLTDETKAALKRLAESRGISMSEFTSDLLEQILKKPSELDPVSITAVKE